MFEPEAWAAVSKSPMLFGFVALMGALWGSFANVCIYRMPPSDEFPKGRSVVFPGSHCFACGHMIRWYDNIPLLSFLWLRGQCRDCGASFSPRYLLVEGVVAMLFAAVFYYVVAVEYTDLNAVQQLLRAGIMAAYLWVLVVVAFIDLDHRLILNKLTYVCIPVFYALGVLLLGYSWTKGVIGIAVGYGGIRGIADLFWLLTKREGIGYGDGKLLAIVGALFGWQGVFFSLFLGSVLGTFLILPMLGWKQLAGTIGSRGKKQEEPLISDSDDSEKEIHSDAPSWREIEIPFGPFISVAAAIYVFVEARLQLGDLYL